MNPTWERKLVSLLLAASLLTGGSVPTLAQPPPAGPESSLAESREFIKSGDYDEAIKRLKDTIGRAPSQPNVLRDAYLLLIEAVVIKGISDQKRPQGQHDAELNFAEANRLIAECLGIPALRHTRPDETLYPTEMVRRFDGVRAQLLGGVRVTALEPASALVLLDADTLRASANGQGLEATDVPAGPHQVVVQCRGFRSHTETISIPPGETPVLSYVLRRRHGRWWYATRAGGLGGAAAILLVAGRSSKSGPSPPADLPGPPDPPSGH